MLPEKQPYSEKLACDPQRSVIVSACAGSGKTWLLVARMVRLLLADVKPQEILALTFTRKAAQEMRDRLYGLLEQFSKVDDAALTAPVSIFINPAEINPLGSNAELLDSSPN